MNPDPSQRFSLRTWTLANRIQWLITLAVMVLAAIYGQWWLLVVAAVVSLLVTKFVTAYQNPWWSPEVKDLFHDPVAFKAWRVRELIYYGVSFAVALMAIAVGSRLVNTA